LRLPVASPAWQQGLRAAAGALATGCVAGSALRLGAPAEWVAAGAVLVAATVWRALGRRAPLRVGGLCASADPAAWRLLLDSGWAQARLLGCRRGACWLSLTLWLDDAAAGSARRQAITVWQPALRPAAWRRLCIVAARASVPRAQVSPV